MKDYDDIDQYLAALDSTVRLVNTVLIALVVLALIVLAGAVAPVHGGGI